MRTLFPLALLGSAALLWAAPAHAQRAFQVGPTLGATLSTVALDKLPLAPTTTLSWRGGFLAGVTGAYRSPGHWGGQLAVLYVQQGYAQQADYAAAYYAYQTTDHLRLNYLRVPVQATFSQRAGGQGFQLFAGPYAGVLLGGQRTYELRDAGGGFTERTRVVVAESYTPLQLATLVGGDMAYLVPDYTAYSRRLDVGLQGGLGYRLGNALLQVGYTLGLRNLATTTVYSSGASTYSVAGEPYRTRGGQVALTYLLGKP